VVKSNLIAGYTYYLSYASTSALACPNNDPIVVISNTNPIAVGSILTDENGGSLSYPFYYSDGTNWYDVYSNSSEQTYVLSTGSCASTTLTINWSNNFITTGTNNLQILKNGNLIVDQYGQSSGSFSVESTDLITYALYSTTPDFTQAIVSVDSFGPNTRDDCNFNNAYASNTGGFYFTSNGTIDGITTNYIDGCP